MTSEEQGGQYTIQTGNGPIHRHGGTRRRVPRSHRAPQVHDDIGIEPILVEVSVLVADLQDNRQAGAVLQLGHPRARVRAMLQSSPLLSSDATAVKHMFTFVIFFLSAYTSTLCYGPAPPALPPPPRSTCKSCTCALPFPPFPAFPVFVPAAPFLQLQIAAPSSAPLLSAYTPLTTHLVRPQRPPCNERAGE